jgi:hypothetical protein
VKNTAYIVLGCLALATPLAVIADHFGDYTYTVSNGMATINSFNFEYSGSLLITNKLGGYPVTTIGLFAFSNPHLINVTIPSSVTNIEWGAFGSCDNMTNVTIPSSVIHIADYTFTDCPNMLSFSVAPGNPNYSSDKGVLFNKKKTSLLSG